MTAGSRPLAYFRERADAHFWSQRWEAESLDHLLAVAQTSELTRFLERFVRPGCRLLEGGCGLGQYVRYFGERGVAATGVDYSEAAIAAHRAAYPGSDVRTADLAELPFADGSFDVYLSLGVIEHYVDGGGAILAEAHRVLAPGGVLLLSTPYANRSRRLLRRRIEREERKRAGAGAPFYQYAFDEASLDVLLARAGFTVSERSYYDPGRGLRDLRALVAPARSGSGGAPATPPRPRAHSPVKRALLYSRPVLRSLAHMQVVAARPVVSPPPSR